MCKLLGTVYENSYFHTHTGRLLVFILVYRIRCLSLKSTVLLFRRAVT